MFNLVGIAQHDAPLTGLNEHGFDIPRKGGRLDLLVRLEIPQHAPAIQITRADGNPVIAQDQLGVQEAGLVLVNHHPTREESGIEQTSGAACRGSVRERAWEQQAHIDAATGRPPQGSP